MIETTRKIDVEALKSRMIGMKPILPSFRFPMTTEQAKGFLTAAYQTEVERRHRKFLDDDLIRKRIEEVAKFFTEEHSKFGLMLRGNCGNGKTTMLYAVQLVINYLGKSGLIDDKSIGIRIIDAKDIAACMKENIRIKICQEPMLAIEDMGREPTEVVDYGNITCPIIDLLEYRYNNRLFTFITTNLKVTDIRKKYGDRIADRFNEMMKIMPFTNGTYREL